MDIVFSKSYGTEGIVLPYRICKFGAADLNVLQAAAATDKLIGVTDRLGAAVSGDRCEVHHMGLREVEYGGTVAAGDELTSDATGRAITAAPAAGANVEIIGRAQVAGVVGDIGKVLVFLGSRQG